MSALVMVAIMWNVFAFFFHPSPWCRAQKTSQAKCKLKKIPQIYGWISDEASSSVIPLRRRKEDTPGEQLSQACADEYSTRESTKKNFQTDHLKEELASGSWAAKKRFNKTRLESEFLSKSSMVHFLPAAARLFSRPRITRATENNKKR